MTGLINRMMGVAFALTLTIASARAVEFADLVRDLNLIQNRMVMGDTQAQAAVARQFDLVEQFLSTVDPEIWADEKNVRAAAIYLLAGGAPEKIRDFFDAGFVLPELAPLLEASLDYAEGQTLAATKLLMELDARRFSPVLGGHLALVQGGSISPVDKSRAATLFDLARLLMPASLVEEAALRREIVIIDPSRESDKLSLLADRYVAKYLASPYAGHFWSEIRKIVLDPARRGDDPFFKKFQTVLEKAPSSERVDMLLTLSRHDILDGRLAFASTKLKLAARGADADTTKKRIDAYHIIIDALSKGEGSDAALSSAIESKDLPQEDIDLMRMVAAVLARLGGAPATEIAPTNASSEEPAILARARAAIAQSDALLQSAARK